MVEQETESSAKTLSSPYFPVSAIKLILMSIFTFGIYEFYWFYKNWQRVKSQTGESLSPFWRAIFSIFFCYPLFKRIKEKSTSEGISSRYNTSLVAISYIVLLLLTGSNIEIYGNKLLPIFGLYYFSFLTFLPLVFVQLEVNDLNKKLAPQADKNIRFSVWNIAAIIVGGFLLLKPDIGSDLVLDNLSTSGRTLQIGSEVQGELVESSVVLGNFFQPRYLQAWALEGKSGSPVSVDLISDEFDPYLIIVGSGLPQMLEDDDGAGGCYSRLSFNFPKDGIYRVIVTSSRIEETGQFNLCVTETPGPKTPGKCGE